MGHASRLTRTITAVVMLVLALAACSGSGRPAEGGGGGEGGEGGGDGVLKIALSNSYIGNQWRVEMVNSFTAACAMPPLADQVECSVFNSGNDVAKQTQQMTNLISEGVDAIVLNAASPTGLNGIVKQACDRDILVVSFDNIVTEPCALKVNTDQVKFGEELAQFLVDKLGGEGNVIMVTGVAGTSVDDDRNNGAMSVFEANPGMAVVRTYAGDWDSATAQRNTAAQLASLPEIDGIWAQGGTDGVLKAFIDAGRPLPVTAGEAENGFRKFLLEEGYEGHTVEGLSIGQPPFLSVVSLELARAILTGERERGDITIPFPKVTNETVELGVTVFDDQPDSFFTTFTDSGPEAVVELCVEAALTGEPCPGELTVRLP